MEALVRPCRSKVEDKKGLDGVIYLKNILQNFNSQSGLHDSLSYGLHSSALSHCVVHIVTTCYNMLEHVATTKCPGQAQYFRHFSTLQRQHGDHVAGDRGARKIKLTFCREELYADCRLIAAYCSCSVSLTLKKHCARQGSSLTSNSASASGNPKTHSC